MSTNPTPFEQKQKERAEIINQIKTTLTKLKRPDQVFEIRLFLKDGKTVAGMFDHNHLDDCIAGIWQYYQAAKAFYFVLNDFPADLLSWSANKFRVIKSGDHTVADKHISHRTHVLIDIDPKRLSKEGIELADVSSTNEEKEKAKQKLNEILKYLRSLGWPEPMIVDSGNGYHLIFAIDLPNTDNSTTLVKNLLLALAQQFDDPCVQVDKKVFNSSRITKLAGTVARKGDPIESRPHRTAKILHLPEEMLVVSEEQLREVASLFKEETKTTSPKTENNYSAAKREASNKGFADLSTRIHNYMDKLPMAVSGQDGSGATFRAACVLLKGFGLSVNEALSYLEEWNQTHCSPTWKTKDLLHKLNDADKAPSEKPIGYLLSEFTPPKTAKTTSSNKDNSIPKNTDPPKAPGKSGIDLLNQTFAPIQWVVESLFTEGSVNIVSSKPKLGKSCLMLGAGLAISCGGKFLGKQVKKRDVLYLALEDSPRRLQDRANKLLLGETIGDGFYYETNFPSLEKGGEELLEQWSIKHPSSVVIVDVLGKIKPPETKDNNGYAYEYSVISRFKALAEEHNVTFVLVHHNRKQDATDAFDCVIGSTGLTASVDASLVLKKDRGKADAILAVTGRDVEESEYKLQFNFPHWTMLGEASAYKVSSTQEKILTILKESNSPLSPEEVIKTYYLEYPDENVKKDNLRQMFYYLLKCKKIVAMDRGKYSTNDSYNSYNTNNTYNSYNSYNANNNSNSTGNTETVISTDESTNYTGKLSNDVRNDVVDVRDVRISNIDSYISNPLEKQQITSNVRNVRKDVSNFDSISEQYFDNAQNEQETSINTTSNTGQTHISDPDIAKSIIEVTPEIKLARRALACGEWLGLNRKLVSRVLLNNGEMLTEPEQYCRFLHHQFKQGVQLPNFVKELEIIETTISTAIKSLSVSGH